MGSEDNKIEKVLQKGIDNYLSNLELRNAIYQIPGIGNIVDYMLVNLGQGFQQRRLIQTIEFT